MKKSIASIIVLALLGVFLGSQAIAWNQNHMSEGNTAHMSNQNMQQGSGNYREFMQESASIRQQIAKDRAKLQTLRAQQNTDQEKVSQLRSRIADNKSKLQEMAGSHNVNMHNMQNRQGQNNMNQRGNMNQRNNMNSAGNMMGSQSGGGCW